MNQDNFYSIERLVEFGLGANLAGRMVASMNQALQNVSIPGAHYSPLQAPAHHYFAVLDGKQVGPLSDVELIRLMQNAQISKDTLIWRPGLSQWQALQNVPDALRLLALLPPPLPTQE